jgi:hypothetical protein
MPVVYLALLVPLFVTIVFFVLKRHEFVWWEFFVPFFVVLLAIVISKLIIDHTTVKFDEYWGSTIVSVTEEEPYNYWHSQTCSEEYACGTDSEGNTKYCTRYYDCSRQVDVGPSWSAKTSIGKTIKITEKEHDELVIRFKTKKVVVSKHRNHDSSDRCVSSKGTKFEGKRVGDFSYVYETTWNGTDETRKSYVSKHSYENRIKASDLSIFNISIVTEELADSLGLFKYPDYTGGIFNSTNGLDYPTILGGNISKETQEKFRNLNGKFGVSNQLRLWILIFENKPMEIAHFQENYWVKGNKNELVVCIGKKGDEIQWAHSFSWSLSDILTVEVKNKVLELYTYKDSIIKVQVLPPVIILDENTKKKVLGEKIGENLPPIIPITKEMSNTTKDSTISIRSTYPVLNEKTLDDYYNFLNKNLHRFERRSFKEFSYITVEPSTGAVIFIYLLALAISVGVNFWVIKNDISD